MCDLSISINNKWSEFSLGVCVTDAGTLRGELWLRWSYNFNKSQLSQIAGPFLEFLVEKIPHFKFGALVTHTMTLNFLYTCIYKPITLILSRQKSSRAHYFCPLFFRYFHFEDKANHQRGPLWWMWSSPIVETIKGFWLFDLIANALSEINDSQVSHVVTNTCCNKKIQQPSLRPWKGN